MFDVSYAVELEYLRDEDTGVAYPGLWLEIGPLKSPDAAVHIRCTLDSGASRSIVRGEVALALGLDLLSGPAQTYATLAGTRLEARLHRVRLTHPELGGHELECPRLEERDGPSRLFGHRRWQREEICLSYSCS